MKAPPEEHHLPSVRQGWPIEAVDAVGGLLAHVAELRRENEQLRTALTSRVVIEQAKGVLAERHLLVPERAFQALRRAARDGGRPLRELAQDVIRETHTPPEILRQLEEARR